MASLPMLETVQTLHFNAGGNALALRGQGWSIAERDFTWMTGPRSVLTLYVPDLNGAFFLQLRLTPFTAGNAPVSQRLTLVLNGYEIGAYALDATATITCFVPPEALAAQGPQTLVLDHPDATDARVAMGVEDDRQLAVGVHRIRLLRIIDRPAPRLSLQDAPEAPRLREMLLDFENLGETGAFARFRAHESVRPLDLVQGGEARLADWLALLDTDFAGLSAPDALQAAIDPAAAAAEDDGAGGGADRAAADASGPTATWSIVYRHGHLRYDTGIQATARGAEAVVAREAARLAIAVRRLRQTLAQGDRLLLLNQPQPASDADIVPLLAAVQERGPNTLLWVTPADAAHPAGSVEVLMAGLLRGYVAPFAADDAAAGWPQMCRLAWRTWQAMLRPAAREAAD